SEKDDTRPYAITDTGRSFVVERKTEIDEIRDRMGARWNPDFRHEQNDMKQELRNLGRLFDRRMRMHWAHPDKLRRIHAVIKQASQDVERILTEQRPPAAPSPTGGPAGGVTL